MVGQRDYALSGRWWHAIRDGIWDDLRDGIRDGKLRARDDIWDGGKIGDEWEMMG